MLGWADSSLWSRYHAFSWLCAPPSTAKLPWSQHEAESFIINEGKIVRSYKGSTQSHWVEMGAST